MRLLCIWITWIDIFWLPRHFRVQHPYIQIHCFLQEVRTKSITRLVPRKTLLRNLNCRRVNFLGLQSVGDTVSATCTYIERKEPPLALSLLGLSLWNIRCFPIMTIGPDMAWNFIPYSRLATRSMCALHTTFLA